MSDQYQYRYLYESSAWYRYWYECLVWYRYRYWYGSIGGTLICHFLIHCIGRYQMIFKRFLFIDTCYCRVSVRLRFWGEKHISLKGYQKFKSAEPTGCFKKSSVSFLFIPQALKHHQIKLRAFFNSPFHGLLKKRAQLWLYTHNLCASDCVCFCLKTNSDLFVQQKLMILEDNIKMKMPSINEDDLRN